MQPLEAFNRLPCAAQLLYTWEHGYYLAARPEEAPGLIKLYQRGELFEEIHFRNPSEFEIVRAFRDPGLLLPCLDQLNPDELLD